MNILKNASVCGSYIWGIFKRQRSHSVDHYREHEMCFDVFNDRQDKQRRIDTLLYVRQVKNTYFKYAKMDLFDPQLYNLFVGDENFDGGDTAFDDDSDTRIFDEYVIDYIKNREAVLMYLKERHSDVAIVDTMDAMNDRSVMFVIDMKNKELFQYCYSVIGNSSNTYKLKDIIFGILLKRNGTCIRTSITSFEAGGNNHAYLIMENLLK